ncbi:hypothetical protein PflA506_1457 [Pseudomonas fluorescens A506]|nr:hypothetical protein PflA506_1457 [Pseudomonas fluorescens A506]
MVNPLGFGFLASLPYQLNQPPKLISISVVDNFKKKRPLLNLPIQIRKKLFDRHA